VAKIAAIKLMSYLRGSKPDGREPAARFTVPCSALADAPDRQPNYSRTLGALFGPSLDGFDILFIKPPYYLLLLGRIAMVDSNGRPTSGSSADAMNHFGGASVQSAGGLTPELDTNLRTPGAAPMIDCSRIKASASVSRSVGASASREN
jgi:hypothetical protein